MKIVTKTLALFVFVVVAILATSCSNDDSRISPMNGKQVVYRFKIEEASTAGFTASINYIDNLMVTRGEDYMGNALWYKSYDVATGFAPAMSVQIQRTADISSFPVTLKFLAQVIISNLGTSNIEKNLSFKNIEEYNAFFQNDNNRFVINPLVQH